MIAPSFTAFQKGASNCIPSLLVAPSSAVAGTSGPLRGVSLRDGRCSRLRFGTYGRRHHGIFEQLASPLGGFSPEQSLPISALVTPHPIVPDLVGKDALRGFRRKTEPARGDRRVPYQCWYVVLQKL